MSILIHLNFQAFWNMYSRPVNLNQFATEVVLTFLPSNPFSKTPSHSSKHASLARYFKCLY